MPNSTHIAGDLYRFKNGRYAIYNKSKGMYKIISNSEAGKITSKLKSVSSRTRSKK